MSEKQFPPAGSIPPHDKPSEDESTGTVDAHSHSESEQTVDGGEGPVVAESTHEEETPAGHEVDSAADTSAGAGRGTPSVTLSVPDNWREDKTMLSVLTGGIAFFAIILAAVVGYSLGADGKTHEGVCEQVSYWGDKNPSRETAPDGRGKFEIRFEQGTVNACIGGVVEGVNFQEQLEGLNNLSGVAPLTGGMPMYGGGDSSMPSLGGGGDLPSLEGLNISPEQVEELLPLVEQYLGDTGAN